MVCSEKVTAPLSAIPHRKFLAAGREQKQMHLWSDIKKAYFSSEYLMVSYGHKDHVAPPWLVDTEIDKFTSNKLETVDITTTDSDPLKTVIIVLALVIIKHTAF